MLCEHVGLRTLCRALAEQLPRLAVCHGSGCVAEHVAPGFQRCLVDLPAEGPGTLCLPQVPWPVPEPVTVSQFWAWLLMGAALLGQCFPKTPLSPCPGRSVTPHADSNRGLVPLPAGVPRMVQAEARALLVLVGTGSAALRGPRCSVSFLALQRGMKHKAPVQAAQSSDGPLLKDLLRRPRRS